MQENGFWDDVKRAEEVTKECKIIKDKIERYENLVSRIDDVDSEKIQVLKKVLTSEKSKKFLEENYKGVIVPVF